MEKAQLVVAIDQNPRARMFRFADLGVVGDVHEILPKVISRIEEQK
jgi:electron transfer flavoprotein alpha subunit